MTLREDGRFEPEHVAVMLRSNKQLFIITCAVIWNIYSAVSLLHVKCANSTHHMITPTNFMTMSLSTTKKSTMSLALAPICPASNPNAKQNTIIPGTWVECLNTLAYISDIGANHCQQIHSVSHF